MKKITLLIIILLSSILGFSQTTVTIGTGTLASTTTQNGNPIYRSSATSAFNYSQSVQLVDAVSLGTAGVSAGATITKIAYYKTTAFTLANGNTASLNIYMKNSGSTSLVNNQDMATWTAGSTLVYANPTVSAADIPAAAGWVEFTLSTPFNYSGGAIEVALDWAGSAGSGLSDGAFLWQYTATSNFQAVGTSASGPITGNLTTLPSARIYNTQLTFTTVACSGVPAPGATVASNTSPCPGDSVSFSTQNPTIGSGVTYQWYKDATLIAGATSSVYSEAIVASGSYHCEVTCSGNTTATTPIVVSPNIINTFPYLEDFATFLPNCWQQADNGDLTAGPATFGTSGWVADGFGNNGTTGSIRYEIWLATANDWIISPLVSIPATNYELKFDAAVTQWNTTAPPTNPWEPDDYVEVLVSTGFTNWTVLYTYNNTNVPSTTGDANIIDLDAYAGQNVRFAFRVVEGTANGTTDLNFYVDNFQIRLTPTCVEPTLLTVDTITTNSANLGWTESGTATAWEIEYGVSGFTPGNGTLVAAPTNPSVISGLMSNTSYDFYVRAVCSPTDSSYWSGPFTFKTQCGEVTEYFEDFEAYPSGTSSLPDCWSRGGSSILTYITTGATAPMSPTKRLYMSANGATPTETFAILPAVSNLQAGTHRLKFLAYSSSGSNRFIEVGYLTDPTDVSTFVQLEEVSIPGTAIATTQELIVVPGMLPAGVKHLAIKNPGFPGATTIAYIDNVTWEAIPACPEPNPNSLNASNITPTSADLSWTEMGSATLWNIEYGPTGYTQGSGTLVSGVTTNPYTQTSLTPATTYDFYVQADCGGTNGTSVWIGPFTFITECVPFVAPFNESFDGLALTSPYTAMPTCWEAQTGPDFWDVTNGTTNSPQYLPGVVDHTSGTGKFMWIDASTDITPNQMVSPLIDMSALTTPLVGFWFASNNVTNAINHTIALDVWDGAAWLNIATETGNFADWQQVAANVPATVPSTTKFRIYAIANPTGTSANYFQNDLGVDDFFVVEAPTVVASCATNVVATPDASCGNGPTIITWDAVPGATGHFITIGTTPGGNDVLNNFDSSSTPSYSFIGRLNTTYYYTITPYNTVGPATGCVEQSFTTVATGCYCPSTPSSVDGTGITNVQIGTTNFPISVPGAPYYSNQTATVVDMNQGISNNLQISFNTSIYNYNVYIYVDLNDNYIFDASELLFSGVSSSTSPNVFDASFVMPATAPIGNHRMRIVSADFLPTADPCYSGTYGFTVDHTINVVVPSCSPAVATATLAPDCANNQFFVAVDVTALGNGTPVLSYGTTSTPVTATGVIQAGPFTDGSSVTLTILHGTDSACDLALGTFTYTCPPANDDCATATALTPGGVFADNAIVSTNVAATNSNPPAPGCASFQGGDVWFSVVVPASGNITIETNSNPGSTMTDTGMAVYSGTCAALTLVECDDDDSLDGAFSLVALTGQTPGATLYVNVWKYAGGTGSTFRVSAYDASLSNASFDNASFVAYPNPVIDVLNLSYATEIASVKVINLLGQEVISRNIGSTSTQVDMSTLAAGAYIVNVVVDDVVKSIKVIKQ